MPEKVTDVAVGVIFRDNGQILLGSRPEGKPWAGWWELPGGKIEPGESVTQALARELKEEIGFESIQAHPWVTHVHRYPTTTVRLHFCRVTQWSPAEPKAQENQQLQWMDIDSALQRQDLLPATYPPLKWLQIPTRYLITNIGGPEHLPAFLSRLQTAVEQGIKLVQWREPVWQQTYGVDSVYAGMQQVLSFCNNHQVRLLVNSVHPEVWWSEAHGVHLRAQDAQDRSERPALPANHWVGASTHCPQELGAARALGADFAVLGPVLPTLSHPGEPAIGWDTFEQWSSQAGLPVLAIGGQSSASFDHALSRGAHGIAGIRQIIG